MIKNVSVLSFGKGSLLMSSDLKGDSNTGVLKIKEIPEAQVGQEYITPPGFFDDSDIEIRFSNIESLEALLTKLNDVHTLMSAQKKHKLVMIDRTLGLAFRISEQNNLSFNHKEFKRVLINYLYKSDADKNAGNSFTKEVSELEDGVLYFCVDKVLAGYRSGDKFIVLSVDCKECPECFIPLEDLNGLNFIDSYMEEMKNKHIPIHIRLAIQRIEREESRNRN